MKKNKSSIYKKLYQNYSKEYNKRSKMLLGKGRTMYDTKLSYREFKDEYKYRYREKRKLVDKGELQNVGNINKQIVRAQTYAMSDKQIKVAHKMGQATGDNYTYAELETMGWEDLNWGSISNTRQALKEAGLSNEQIGKYISREYFGSPD